MSDEVLKMPSDGGDKQRMGPFLEGPGFAQIASGDQRYDQGDRSSSAAGSIHDRAADYWKQLSDGWSRLVVIRYIPKVGAAYTDVFFAWSMREWTEIVARWLERKGLMDETTPIERLKAAIFREAYNDIWVDYFQARIDAALLKAEMWRVVGREMSAARAVSHVAEYGDRMLLHRKQFADYREMEASYRAQMQEDQPGNAGSGETPRNGESL